MSLADQREEPRRKPRWYRLTPDRAVWLLLVGEGLLWLSERYQWFPFNAHKGWTVLIALAALGAVVLVMLLAFIAALLFRWRFQFSIRSLLVLAAAVALPCAWLAVERKAAKKQREAVAEIVKNGPVAYDYEFDASQSYVPNAKPPGLPWLRRLLGDDFFSYVRSVYGDPTGIYDEFQRRNVRHVNYVTDAALERLKDLPCLWNVDLSDTEVTDAGLEHLKGLTQLQRLRLDRTQVTDAGLGHLKGLTQLRCLTLDNTRVTDAGLEHLKGFTQLRCLMLGGTCVTDAALQRLKGLTQLQELDLSSACGRVTDAGLERLKGLTKLQQLDLSFARVTDAGLKHLRGLTQLQWLGLSATGVTDAGLEHLRGLTQLQWLNLVGTEVTAAGVKKLQQALPKCEMFSSVALDTDLHPFCQIATEFLLPPNDGSAAEPLECDGLPSLFKTGGIIRRGTPFQKTITGCE